MSAADATSSIHNSRNKRSIVPLYYELSALEYRNPAAASGVLDEFVDEVDEYVGPPELWHNLIAIAGRVNRDELQLPIVRAALREWPQNVALLTDELQCYRSFSYDPAQARRVWDELSKLPLELRAPYWTYWVYGANYLALELNNPEAAIAHLDRGIGLVRRDGLMDVLRAYRRVLVDSVPRGNLANETEVRRTQQSTVQLLESRYRFGIDLGIENAYVLAMDLARLHQEQAGLPGTGSAQSLSYAQNANLTEALHDLDVAEALYTGDQNHPIHEIYERRARIFMAQRRFGDALKLLRSLPDHRKQELSVRTMLQLAARSVGESADEDGSAGPQTITPEQMVQLLLGNGGAFLREAVRKDPRVQQIVIQTLQQLAAERERGGGRDE